MYTDIFGNKRYKINLHMHTSDSDGSFSPAEAARLYRDAGYDAIAITDHWRWRSDGQLEGIKVFSGSEYDFGKDPANDGVYHIVALFCVRDPGVTREDTPQSCIDKILKAEGIAVLAHPAWSLNLPEKAAELVGVEHTEIYNTVSGVENSFRPCSSAFVDLMACKGRALGLLAADDTHYYTDDAAVAAVMVACDKLERDSVMQALKNGDYYATTGPEVHIRIENGETVVSCSPVVCVDICTNAAFGKGRHFEAENITERRVPLSKVDKYVRAEVTDANGKKAYSNFLIVR